MNLSLLELTSAVNGILCPNHTEVVVTGFANLQDAKEGDLSFFYDVRYASQLQATKASVVLIPEDYQDAPQSLTCIRVGCPSKAFETIVEEHGVQPNAFQAGVHPSAVIAAGVQFDPTKVCIAPCAVIDEDAVLSDGVSIGAGSYVGRGVTIGKDSTLHANVCVQNGCILGERVTLHPGVVIGGDGFGYVFEQGRHRKIRQAGIVQLDNDVEIGAGTMVDRARFGKTWIGEGTKIDNLVQIGHNATIGRHCILVAGVAIAGSAQIGDYVVIAAQSGIAGHVKIGSGATLGSRSGVTKDLVGGQTYMGFPAQPARLEKRRHASINRLPMMLERIKELETKLLAMQEADAAKKI